MSVEHKTHTEILGKNPLPISLLTFYRSRSVIGSFLYYKYSFQINFSPFPVKLASHNSIEKRDDNLGSNIRYKKSKRKDREKLRKLELDSKKKKEKGIKD